MVHEMVSADLSGFSPQDTKGTIEQSPSTLSCHHQLTAEMRNMSASRVLRMA